MLEPRSSPARAPLEYGSHLGGSTPGHASDRAVLAMPKGRVLWPCPGA